MRTYFGNLTVNVFELCLWARITGGELGQSLHDFDCFTLSLYEFVPKDTLTARKLILEKVLFNFQIFNMLNVN